MSRLSRLCRLSRSPEGETARDFDTVGQFR